MNFIYKNPLLSLSALFGGSVLFLVGCFVLLYQDAEAWKTFKESHNCKIIAESASSLSYGTTTNGRIGTYATPKRTTYRCDDGVEYTR
ncbi:hypothetical protein UFOVP116_225 [uncultured Caudovirales phage]|uniref:Lipoprotein n=1 Tax=uncultured Caudovirales phage TaxID=2100421 RepID=A0A6J5L6K2_9CAUD|nr:hypothetical protein UFOVP116_225 [uncultured Caudovirales phage]